jgi:MFS family permease
LEEERIVPYGFRDRTGWYVGLSSYWFATSFKWFVMFLLLGLHVAAIVPEEEKNRWWGLIAGTGATWAMIGPAIFGWFSDRCTSRFGRRRPFLAVGSAMTAIALVVLGHAESIPGLFMAYLLLQLSDDVATGPYAALIPDLVPEQHRGKASGIMGLLHSAAQIAAVGASLVLRDIVLIFYFVAVLNLVCAAIVIFTVRERPKPRDAIPAEKRLEKRRRIPLSGLVAAWVQPFRDRDFRWVWLTRFLNQLGFYLILLYVANYLADVVREFEIGPLSADNAQEAALYVALAISVTAAIGAMRAGPLADRIGRKRVILTGGWIMFAALVPFSFLPIYSAIIPLALIFGLGFGAYQASNWALVADVLPSEEDIGKDMGIWQMSIAAPQVFSGAAGVMIDLVNRQFFGLGYQITFFLASLVFLASTQLIKKVKGSS